MTRIIIAGTRTFEDYALLRKVMSQTAGHIPHDEIEIICGGAKGADKLGEKFARQNSLKLTRFLPEWDKYGKAAGPVRNKAMAEYAGGDGFLVAFWDRRSKGTKNMIKNAGKAGLWTRVVSIAEEDYGTDIGVPEGW